MGRVLIVDDNIQNCDILKDVISTWEYQVDQAYHGKEAMDIVRKNKPDIILLDVMLPGMNGFEVCSLLKNDPETQNIIIIMLTVLNDVEDKIRGLKVGADLFLSKPVNYEELRIRLTALMNFKKKLDSMEELESVVNLLLGILKKYDLDLYNHTISVRHYADRISSLLSINEEVKKKIIYASSLVNIGKLMGNSDLDHISEGLAILKPLKNSLWINRFVMNLDQKIEQLAIEQQIVKVANDFAGFLKDDNNKDNALSLLLKKYSSDVNNNQVIFALKQVLEDEKFLHDFIK